MLLRALVATRVAASAIAIPLFPFLYRQHYFVLALLRPSPAVLAGGGFRARQTGVGLWQVAVAAIPMQFFAVWLYFAIGRAWAKEIGRDDRLPLFAARFLPPKRIQELRKVLRTRGTLVVFLSRFAIVPVGLVAVSAGAAKLEPRRYFTTDALAATLHTALAIGAGYLLGFAADRASPWVVVLGVAGLVALSVAVTIVWRRIK